MRDVRPITLMMLFGAALLLHGCDDPERNVILERAPFFEDSVPHNPKDTDRMVSAVRQFADENGMEFLQGGGGPKGDYNLTAASRDMNFKVIYSGAVEPNTTTIWVYARSNPSDAQQQRAKEFACAVKQNCDQ